MLCARIITQLAAGGRRQGSVPDEQVVRVAVHPLATSGVLGLVTVGYDRPVIVCCMFPL